MSGKSIFLYASETSSTKSALPWSSTPLVDHPLQNPLLQWLKDCHCGRLVQIHPFFPRTLLLLWKMYPWSSGQVVPFHPPLTCFIHPMHSNDQVYIQGTGLWSSINIIVTWSLCFQLARPFHRQDITIKRLNNVTVMKIDNLDTISKAGHGLITIPNVIGVFLRVY